MQAHIAIQGDIFVTCSERVLTNRDRSDIAEGNPRRPTEALAIAHLLLRSRGVHQLYSAPWAAEDEYWFYWGLMRQRLPSFWPYWSACLAAGQAGQHRIQELGSAILDRARRLFIARDEIAKRFYQPLDTAIRDQILYHLGYLVFLLSGILDPQAAISRLAHDVHVPAHSDFRDKPFADALRELALRT